MSHQTNVCAVPTPISDLFSTEESQYSSLFWADTLTSVVDVRNLRQCQPCLYCVFAYVHTPRMKSMLGISSQ